MIYVQIKIRKSPLVSALVEFRFDYRLNVDYCRHMEINTATQALAALAQESRLRAFRLLVRSGSGMAAGEIARALDIPHNTLSSHLTILVNAGLIQSHRESRSIIYAINLEGTRTLLGFLMEDCCRAIPIFACPCSIA